MLKQAANSSGLAKCTVLGVGVSTINLLYPLQPQNTEAVSNEEENQVKEMAKEMGLTAPSKLKVTRSNGDRFDPQHDRAKGVHFPIHGGGWIRLPPPFFQTPLKTRYELARLKVYEELCLYILIIINPLLFYASLYKIPTSLIPYYFFSRVFMLHTSIFIAYPYLAKRAYEMAAYYSTQEEVDQFFENCDKYRGYAHSSLIKFAPKTKPTEQIEAPNPTVPKP